jgi:tetratricopeptide (TPR) repeat protein
MDLAIRDYDQAIKLNKNDSVTFINRGKAYNDKGEYDLAIADFDHAIEMNPKDANAFLNRGNAYRAKGDQDHATRDYEEARKIQHPNDTVAAAGSAGGR